MTSKKTTKFSDLLDSAAAFAPLPSAATPEDQFETLSTSSEALSEEAPSSEVSQSDDSDAETSPDGGDSKGSSAPSEELPPASSPAAVLPEGVSTPSEPSSGPLTVSLPPASSSEPAPPKGLSPEPADDASLPASKATTASGPASKTLLPASPEPSEAFALPAVSSAPVEPLLPSSEPLPPSPELRSLDGLSEKKESGEMPLPSRSPAEDRPPPPSQEAGGSVFNLQGLDEAFPLRPNESSDGIMSFEEASREAAKFGVQLSEDSLKKPQRSELGDGSLLLVTPAQALNVTHLSSACVASLKSSGREGQGLLSDVLKKLSSFDASFQASEALLRALQQLESQRIASDCEGAGGGISLQLRQAIAILGKLTAALQEQTSAELVYLKHVNEFRDAKRDVKALAEVLKKDADRVAQVRGKRDAILQRRGPALSASFTQLASQLSRLEQTSKHL